MVLLQIVFQNINDTRIQIIDYVDSKRNPGII
ncbi:hypothetical protein F5613_002107 [Macellibacteroides fermentans]|jgi:hypothetical protein|uniref:Uncharacterized protein n=1 Tax=Macellibacteroides fermentans TaxID=879969 RepID=A0A8E1ZYK1_9PORP|nr:hypothetical protein [Macellibacteroides fermentans]